MIRVLEEKIRKLLVEFAYCDLVKSQVVMGEDFVTGWNSLPDPEQGLKSLSNKGYPFAPLIRLMNISRPDLKRDDSFYLKIKNLQDKELQSTEESIQSI